MLWKHNNVVELHVTVNHINIWSAAHKAFYGKFGSPVTEKRTYAFM